MDHKPFLLFAFIFLTEIHFVAGQSGSISALKFLDEYDVPFNTQFQNTTIGGLSGIDYDPVNQIYYAVCDDRSIINPARFYSVKLTLTEKGIDSVNFVGVHYFLQPNGIVYQNFKTDPAHTPDPESIRYFPGTSQLVWTSEGEKIKKHDHFVTQNPSINISNLNGTHSGNYANSPNVVMHNSDSGARQNGTLEGISFSSDYSALYVSMEEPLYEDGPRADTIKNNAWIRIIKYEVASKQNVAQYAYELEPVAHPPIPANAFIVNGVSEILYLEENKLLVMERSYSTGRIANTIKVFIADLSLATNIIAVPSLLEKEPEWLAQKKLLLNMDTLGIFIDNMEGVTFGPRLPNGNKTLIFVSDNNFNAEEKTQFLLFEVIP